MQFRPHQYFALATVLACHAWLIVVLFPGSELARENRGGQAAVITVSLKQAIPEAANEGNDAAEPAVPNQDDHPKDALSDDAATAAAAAKPEAPTGPRYYKVRELSTAPMVLQDVREDQPIHPGDGAPKKVILHLYINERGEIDQIVPEHSELSFEDTKLLVDRFTHMSFEPGKIDGAAVRTELVIEVNAQAVH